MERDVSMFFIFFFLINTLFIPGRVYPDRPGKRGWPKNQRDQGDFSHQSLSLPLASEQNLVIIQNVHDFSLQGLEDSLPSTTAVESKETLSS